VDDDAFGRIGYHDSVEPDRSLPRVAADRPHDIDPPVGAHEHRIERARALMVKRHGGTRHCDPDVGEADRSRKASPQRRRFCTRRLNSAKNATASLAARG